MTLIESDIQVNGIRLHVYRSGSNKPPLVCVHGMSDSGPCYWPFAEQLTDLFEIILYDSRGHGKSDASRGAASMFDRVRDLAGLVETLKLEKPAIIGHSMGAVTTAMFAGLYPRVPGRIVLEDPPPFEQMVQDAGGSNTRRQAWMQLAAGNKQKSLEELIQVCQVENPTWPENERPYSAQSKREYSMTVFEEDPVDAVEGNHIMSQIICPLLLITADLAKGALYPPDKAEKLVAGLVAGRHVNIQGAGHNIRREQPKAFLKAVRDFLEKTK